MPQSGDFGTRIEQLESSCDLIPRSILHTLDVMMFISKYFDMKFLQNPTLVSPHENMLLIARSSGRAICFTNADNFCRTFARAPFSFVA